MKRSNRAVVFSTDTKQTRKFAGDANRIWQAALSRNGYELSYDPRGRCFKVSLGM